MNDCKVKFRVSDQEKAFQLRYTTFYTPCIWCSILMIFVLFFKFIIIKQLVAFWHFVIFIFVMPHPSVDNAEQKDPEIKKSL